ncbi:MAG: hypothetical protein AAF310_01840 [Myxococcota bacterium]
MKDSSNTTDHSQPQQSPVEQYAAGMWQQLAWWEVAMMALFACVVVWATAPALRRFACKSQRSEARYVLTRFYAAQQLHVLQHDKLAGLQQLRQTSVPATPMRFYDYQLQQPSVDTWWYIVARGRPDTAVHQDVWQIGQRGRLQHRSPMCNGSSRPLQL